MNELCYRLWNQYFALPLAVGASHCWYELVEGFYKHVVTWFPKVARWTKNIPLRAKKTARAPLRISKAWVCAGKCSSMNSWLVFVECDWAKACSNIMSLFLLNIFLHTPMFWRYEGEHVFFGPKWNDVWSIEQLSGSMPQRVYRNLRPTHISGVMRQLWEEVRNTDSKTLTKLVHELPAKMNEIYRQKGAKILSNFDPKKSPFACKCAVCCESWYLNMV